MSHLLSSVADVRSDSVIREQSVPTRKWQASYASLPKRDEGLNALTAQIKASAALDVREIKCSLLRMNPSNGALYREGKDPAKSGLAYTHDAFQQLLSLVGAPRGAAGVLESLSPKTRATAFMELMGAGTRSDEDDLVFRTSLFGPGVRGVRAVVSPRHSQETGDDLVMINALRDALPENAGIRVVRTWDRTDIEAIMTTAKMEVRKGDILHAKVTLTNSETKAYKWKALGGLFRLTCLNGMTRAESGSATSGKHVGNISGRIVTAIRESSKGIEDFANAFGRAYRDEFPTIYATRAAVLERVGKALDLPDHTLTLAGNVWDADGQLSAGNTLGGLANALTRASQELTFDDAETVEIAAGRLVTEGWGLLA